MNTRSVHTSKSICSNFSGTLTSTSTGLIFVCVNGVTNSLHIMEHLAMHIKVGHSHLSTCYHHHLYHEPR